MTVRPSALNAIPLFHGITEAHLAELTRACERLSLDAGQVLFEAGTEPKHFLLLMSGEVALRDGGSGERHGLPNVEHERLVVVLAGEAERL